MQSIIVESNKNAYRSEGRSIVVETNERLLGQGTGGPHNQVVDYLQSVAIYHFPNIQPQSHANPGH